MSAMSQIVSRKPAQWNCSSKRNRLKKNQALTHCPARSPRTLLCYLSYSWFAPDVMAAMMVYRTMAKEVFWEFDFIIMRNLRDILLLFWTPICPPYHVSATQESSQLGASQMQVAWQILSIWNRLVYRCIWDTPSDIYPNTTQKSYYFLLILQRMHCNWNCTFIRLFQFWLIHHRSRHVYKISQLVGLETHEKWNFFNLPSL